MTTKQFIEKNTASKNIGEIKAGDQIVIRGGQIQEVSAIRDGKAYSFNPYTETRLHARPVRGQKFIVLNQPV